MVSRSSAAAAAKEKEKDNRYTKASILMVIAFLLCHVPRFATNTMELLFFSDVEQQPQVLRKGTGDCQRERERERALFN